MTKTRTNGNVGNMAPHSKSKENGVINHPFVTSLSVMHTPTHELHKPHTNTQRTQKKPETRGEDPTTLNMYE